MTYQSLGTETTASTKLTDLTACSGDSLEIADTDNVTVSYVQAGKTYTTTFSAKGATLQDIFTNAEAVDASSQIFASATNKSVAASTGEKDANIVTKASADLAEAKKQLGTVVTGDVAEDIRKYNAAQTDADKKIDLEKLNDYLDTSGTTWALKGTITTDDQKCTFAEKLANDKNYAALIASANGTNAKAMDAKYQGNIGTLGDKKTTYAEAKTIDANANTTLVSSATVGIDANGDKVDTASGEKGMSITANTEGVAGQISGLNISISDSKGNVKKSANAALDAFSETIRAQNKSDDNAISLQVGASANQSIKVGLTDMRAEALGLKGADGTTLNISTQGKANAAINVLDNAIQKALDQQTTIGSVESRLEYTSSNLTTASENVQASESTIRDADMAKEMTNYTKNNVLLQAAQSMLAQANQSSSNVLSLLQ